MKSCKVKGVQKYKGRGIFTSPDEGFECTRRRRKMSLTPHVKLLHFSAIAFIPLKNIRWKLCLHRQVACHRYASLLQIITAELAKASSPQSPQSSNRGKWWWSQRREVKANWKPNTPRPSGFVFFVRRSVPSALYLCEKIRFYKWHGVPSNGAGASSCSTARGAECRRNSLAVPSGTDLPTMCSCAENCHF